MGDTNSSNELTRLLNSLQEDDEAAKKIFPLVYNELHALAHRKMRKERNGHTLNTTALVHEAYLKLVDYPPENNWDGRNHFFGIAARAMRQILVNYARSRNAQKRSGNKNIQPFQEEIYLTEEKAGELVHLEEALTELEKLNERLGKVVECRYFAGYNIEETAEILGISSATVKRDWTSARAWLYNYMHPGE
ncbi:MAG: sigma-70 family RNA polymerase sigma factor [Bacteroidetes bacterium]|jgi:RNA polymerase sigma factor (TIGR02999 family)|nr:sigma-70 family RNA polymerase sigma factor [Bacteroidota bacterium]